MTYDDATDREKRISRVLAVAMHVAFFLLLVVGVSWQKRAPDSGNVVELWSAPTPPRPEPRVDKAPPLKPAPKAERRVEPPPPKPEPKPVTKPDIALKEKLEKERRLKEQELEKERKLKERELERRRLEEEAKRKAKAQQELEARKKLEEEKKKLAELKEMKAQEEAKRLAQEKQELAKRLAAEQAAAQSRIYDEYVRQISSKIRRHIVEPPNLQGNPQVEFEVVLLPGGEVLTAKLKRSSQNAAYDSAVERAILKASPLPLPPDPALFSMFRELHLKIRPKE